MINQVFEHGNCIHYNNEIYCQMDPVGILMTDLHSFFFCTFFIFGLVVVGFILGRLGTGE